MQRRPGQHEAGRSQLLHLLLLSLKHEQQKFHPLNPQQRYLLAMLQYKVLMIPELPERWGARTSMGLLLLLQ